jgi:hypothetical protein
MQGKVKSTTMPLEDRNTLSAMLKESKRHLKCIPSTSETFISCVLFYRYLNFVEKFFISLRTFRENIWRIIYWLLYFSSYKPLDFHPLLPMK